MADTGEVKSLLVAPAWVGDMVMAHSLIRSLSDRAFPTIIDVLAPPATSSLASRMVEVRKIHTLDVGHGQFGFRQRIDTARSLRDEHYDEAFVLPNSWKSALVPFFAGIRKRVGWIGEMRFGLLNETRSLDKTAFPLMVDRFSVLADLNNNRIEAEAPRPSLEFDPDNQRGLIDRYDLDERGAVALAPGAEFGPAKKWPASYYADVAKYCLSKGRQVWLLGSKKDSLDCQWIARQASGCVDLSGKTSLVDVVDLIALAEYLVCNDSGLMHVSASLKTKTLAIFGSTSEKFTPPLAGNSVVLSKTLACRPCFERVCPLGHLNCLKSISPEEAISRLSL